MTITYTTNDAAGNVTGYNVLVYTEALDDVIPQGMRMCYLSWKAMDGKPALSAPRAVFVPIIPLTIAPIELATAMREALEDIHDKQLRKLVEDDLKASRAPSPIPVTACTAQAVSVAYSATATGTRLSKETIASWFTASVADKLALAFAAKSGLQPEGMTAENMAPMVSAAEQRRAVLEKLASPGFTVQPQTALQLIKVIDLADDQTSKIVTTLRTKLDRMSVVEPIDSFGL